MLVHTDYLWFTTKKRQEFVRITDDVAAIVKTSGVTEGTVLVSAMHITPACTVKTTGRKSHSGLSDLARAAGAGRSPIATIRPARTTRNAARERLDDHAATATIGRSDTSSMPILHHDPFRRCRSNSGAPVPRRDPALSDGRMA